MVVLQLSNESLFFSSACGKTAGFTNRQF